MSTPRLRQQRGTALVIAMLFLVILGMLGITTMTATTLEERMAGNVRDRDIALQAAEAALRDAERDLINTNTAFRVVKNPSFVASCAGGLCRQASAASAAEPLTNLTDVTKSSFYGQFTGETALQGPVQQPRYMIEMLFTAPAVPTLVPSPPPASHTIKNFRVSVRGVGKNPNTVVLLQTVFQVAIPDL